LIVFCRNITVVNIQCEPPEVHLIGSKLRVEQSSRKMRFETYTRMKCNLYRLVHKWTVYEGPCSWVTPSQVTFGGDLVSILMSVVSVFLILFFGTLGSGSYMYDVDYRNIDFITHMNSTLMLWSMCCCRSLVMTLCNSISLSNSLVGCKCQIVNLLARNC